MQRCLLRVSSSNQPATSLVPSPLGSFCGVLEAMQSAASLLGLPARPRRSKLLADHVLKGKPPVAEHVHVRACPGARSSAARGPGTADRCRQPAAARRGLKNPQPTATSPSARPVQILLPRRGYEKAQ